MILHREELKLWEEFAAKQRRIYDDACDVGVPLAEIANVEDLRNAANEMIKTFKGQPLYKVSQWGNGKSVEFFIPIEYDGPNEYGYLVHIASHDDRKVAGGGFICCGINRTSRPRTQN